MNSWLNRGRLRRPGRGLKSKRIRPQTIQKNASHTEFLTLPTFTVKVQCNPDANGKITFPTLAYWSNNKDANTCNPYPATKSKCTKGTTTVNVAAIKGKITVKKIAVAVGTFDFAVTGGATQNFSLATGDTRDIEVDAIKTPVDYIITETVPDGWQFSRATCTSSAGGTWSNALGSSAVTVPVSFAHTDISCEFINAKNPPAGTVKLVKSLTTGDLGQRAGSGSLNTLEPEISGWAAV